MNNKVIPDRADWPKMCSNALQTAQIGLGGTGIAQQDSTGS